MTIFDVGISVDAAKVIWVIAAHPEDAAKKATAIFWNDLYASETVRPIAARTVAAFFFRGVIHLRRSNIQTHG